MGSVSAKRHTGGLMTVRLVLRSVSEQFIFLSFEKICYRTSRVTLDSRIASPVLAALREQGKAGEIF